MNKDRFLFFENFRRIANSLPDDLRLKFYDALTAYVFDEVEPEDAIIKSLIIAISPSLDKEEKRGGNHNPTGQNQYSKDKQEEKEVKECQNNNTLGQKEVKSGQSGQSFLETETRNGNKKQETEINIPPSENKFSSVGISSADGEKKYAFEGKVIKLTQKDFDNWQKAYPDLNLYAECLQRDNYLAEQPPDEQKRWFLSTSAFFIKQNERRKAQNANNELEEQIFGDDYL